MLARIGAPPEPQPATRVEATYAVFADTLDTEANTWVGFREQVQNAREELGDFRQKPHEAYRQAAATVTSDPPTVFAELLSRVRELAT